MMRISVVCATSSPDTGTEQGFCKLTENDKVEVFAKYKVLLL